MLLGGQMTEFYMYHEYLPFLPIVSYSMVSASLFGFPIVCLPRKPYPSQMRLVRLVTCLEEWKVFGRKTRRVLLQCSQPSRKFQYVLVYWGPCVGICWAMALASKPQVWRENTLVVQIGLENDTVILLHWGKEGGLGSQQQFNGWLLQVCCWHGLLWVGYDGLSPHSTVYSFLST